MFNLTSSTNPLKYVWLAALLTCAAFVIGIALLARFDVGSRTETCAGCEISDAEKIERATAVCAAAAAPERAGLIVRTGAKAGPDFGSVVWIYDYQRPRHEVEAFYRATLTPADPRAERPGIRFLAGGGVMTLQPVESEIPSRFRLLCEWHAVHSDR